MRAVRRRWDTSSAVKWRILTKASTGSKYFRTTFGSIRIMFASGLLLQYFTTRGEEWKAKIADWSGYWGGEMTRKSWKMFARAIVAPAPTRVTRLIRSAVG